MTQHATAIEWTHRPGTKGETWNPIRARNLATGKVGWHCEHASDGCRNCYAETLNLNRRNFAFGTGLPYKPGHRQEAKSAGGATGTKKTDLEIFLDEKTLFAPLSWRTPRTIFVCSMTDLFGAFVSEEMIDRIFAVMALCPQHTFIVLTKRSARMRAYLNDLHPGSRIGTGDLGNRVAAQMLWMGFERVTSEVRRSFPLPNVWLGVSAEDQATADERIPHLLATPAALRFVSAEPLLGPIDFYKVSASMPMKAHPWRNGPILQGVHWIIVGGESGTNARPMHPDWARSIRGQCDDTGTAFFFKQWGEHRPLTDAEHGQACGATLIGNDPHDREAYVLRVGKHRAGRMLDGREHSDFPQVPA